MTTVSRIRDQLQCRVGKPGSTPSITTLRPVRVRSRQTVLSRCFDRKFPNLRRESMCRGSGWNKCGGLRKACNHNALYGYDRGVGRPHAIDLPAAGTNMKMSIPANREGAHRQSAYTLPEVMMGVMIMS